MTTQEIAEYYSNLLIMQYHEKPKAKAMIKALVTPVIIDQLPVQVQNAFNLETAVGVQLDILGKYIGASRNGNAFSNPVTLSDDDFRTLLKMLLIKNNSGSSLSVIQGLLAAAFPGSVFVSDNQNMQLNYVILESLGTPELLQILTTGNYLPAPMGVGTSATIVPVHTNPFFGFRTYAAPDTTVVGFNNYSFYQSTYPWLSYQEV